MASASGNMKGFYRQQKKNTNNKSSRKPQQQKQLKSSPTFGSDVPQPPALVSHGGNLDLQDDYNESEATLRQFDMNMAYGPCIGMTRLQRWERAKKFGLNPPPEIERLLKSEQVQKECLWDGRI